MVASGNTAGAEEIAGGRLLVGYGLQDASRGIDEYAGLDLKGKYAVVLSGRHRQAECGPGRADRRALNRAISPAG